MPNQLEILDKHPWIRPNNRAVHHSGRKYIITCIANTGATDQYKFPLMVVYKDSARSWARPLTEFVEKFTVHPEDAE